MAADHTFDIVSKVNLQEVLNAVDQSMKEIRQRFDFKGSKSNIELDQGNSEITIISDDEYKLKAVTDVLQGKLVKRKVSLKALEYGKIEDAASSTMRQVIKLQQGIPIEKSKEIVKMVKNAKMKVQTEIQGDQVRVKGKKIDDLQTVISMINEKDMGIHMECINFR